MGGLDSPHDSQRMIRQICKQIYALVEWSDRWQMKFNADKCKIMHIGKSNPSYNYTMGGHAPAGVVLGESQVEKDLGVC